MKTKRYWIGSKHIFDSGYRGTRKEFIEHYEFLKSRHRFGFIYKPRIRYMKYNDHLAYDIAWSDRYPGENAYTCQLYKIGVSMGLH